MRHPRPRCRLISVDPAAGPRPERRPRRRTAVFVAALLCVPAALSGPRALGAQRGRADPAIRVTTRAQQVGSPSLGSPTTPFRLVASGFPPGDAVEVYFDRADLATGVADGDGSFAVGMQVPGRAVPG